MGLFRKLQENSLYWRYRFVTRRYLAMRRWWRELRQPGRGRMKIVRAQPRGTASFNPNTRVSRVNPGRGIAFVVIVAAVWALLDRSGLANSGIPILIPQALVLVAAAYAFIRFW